MKLFSLLILFILQSFSTSSQSWKDCWGLEYLYYDETCCTESAQNPDASFHCLEKIPSLQNYNALQLALHAKLDALTTCKDIQQTCDAQLTFIELRQLTADVEGQMNDLATEGVNTLQPEHANLDKIISYILPTSTFGGLVFQVGSTLVVDSATFAEMTLESPYTIPVIQVGNIGKTVDFTGELRNVNLGTGLAIDGINVTASAEDLNTMQGIDTDLQMAEVNMLKNLDVEAGNLNAVKGVGSSITKTELDQIVNLTVNVGDLNVLKNVDPVLSKTELDQLVGLEATAAELNVLDGLTASMAELNNIKGLNVNVREFNTMAGIDPAFDTATLNLLTGLDVGMNELNQMGGINQALTNTELNKLKDLTATKDELNLLTGVSDYLTSTELNKLKGVTATTAELNLLKDVDPALGKDELDKLVGLQASAEELNVLRGVGSGTEVYGCSDDTIATQFECIAVVIDNGVGLDWQDPKHVDRWACEDLANIDPANPGFYGVVHQAGNPSGCFVQSNVYYFNDKSDSTALCGNANSGGTDCIQKTDNTWILTGSNNKPEFNTLLTLNPHADELNVLSGTMNGEMNGNVNGVTVLTKDHLNNLKGLNTNSAFLNVLEGVTISIGKEQLDALVGLNINVGDLNVMKGISSDKSCTMERVLNTINYRPAQGLSITDNQCEFNRATEGARPISSDANYVDYAACERYWKSVDVNTNNYVEFQGFKEGTCTDTTYNNDITACEAAGEVYTIDSQNVWDGYNGSPPGCYGDTTQYNLKIVWNAKISSNTNTDDCNVDNECIILRPGAVEDYGIKIALNKIVNLNVDASTLKVLNNVVGLDSTHLNLLKGLDVTVDELNIMKDVSTDLDKTELEQLIGLTTDNYIGTCSDPTITTEAACIAVAGNTWFPVVHGNDLNVLKGVMAPISTPPETLESVADIQLVGGNVATLQSTDPLFLSSSDCHDIYTNGWLSPTFQFWDYDAGGSTEWPYGCYAYETDQTIHFNNNANSPVKCEDLEKWADNANFNPPKCVQKKPTIITLADALNKIVGLTADADTLNEFPNFMTGEKLEIINDITTVGTSEASKIVTTASNGKTTLSNDVTVTGDVDVPDGKLLLNGQAITVTSAELHDLTLVAQITATTAEINTLDTVTSTPAKLNIMHDMTANTNELNYIDVAAGETVANKVLVTASDNSMNFKGDVEIENLHVQGALQLGVSMLYTDANELNLLDDATFTLAELEYMDGIGSHNPASKVIVTDSSGSTTFNGETTISNTLSVVKNKLKIDDVAVTTTAAELNELDGISAGLTAAELSLMDGITSTTADLNLMAGSTTNVADMKMTAGSSAGTNANERIVTRGATIDLGTVLSAELKVPKDKLHIAAAPVKLTAAEANILDGIHADLVVGDINKLKGITSTTDELNKMDGVTGSTADINTLGDIALQVDGNTMVTVEDITVSGNFKVGESKLEIDSLIVSSSAAELNKMSTTSSKTELNILTGIDSDLTAAEINLIGAITADVDDINLLQDKIIQVEQDGVCSDANEASELGCLLEESCSYPPFSVITSGQNNNSVSETECEEYADAEGSNFQATSFSATGTCGCTQFNNGQTTYWNTNTGAGAGAPTDACTGTCRSEAPCIQYTDYAATTNATICVENGGTMNPVNTWTPFKKVVLRTATINEAKINTLKIISEEVLATPAELNKLSGLGLTTADLNKLTGIISTTAELDLLHDATVTKDDINMLETKSIKIDAETTTIILQDGIFDNLDAGVFILDGIAYDASSWNTAGGSAITSSAAELNLMNGVTVTTEQINKLDGVTSTKEDFNLLALGKILLMDGTDISVPNISSTDSSDLYVTTFEIDGDSIQASAAEMNRIPTLPSIDIMNKLENITATSAELNAMDGVTATITDLNLLQATSIFACNDASKTTEDTCIGCSDDRVPCIPSCSQSQCSTMDVLIEDECGTCSEPSILLFSQCTKCSDKDHDKDTDAKCLYPLDSSGDTITSSADCLVAHKAHNAGSAIGFQDYNGIITQTEANEMLTGCSIKLSATSVVTRWNPYSTKLCNATSTFSCVTDASTINVVDDYQWTPGVWTPTTNETCKETGHCGAVGYDKETCTPCSDPTITEAADCVNSCTQASQNTAETCVGNFGSTSGLPPHFDEETYITKDECKVLNNNCINTFEEVVDVALPTGCIKVGDDCRFNMIDSGVECSDANKCWTKRIWVGKEWDATRVWTANTWTERYDRVWAKTEPDASSRGILNIDKDGVATVRGNANFNHANVVNVESLKIGNVTITSSWAELSTLDTVQVDVESLNILDGVTTTTSELNSLHTIESTTKDLNMLTEMDFHCSDLREEGDVAIYDTQQACKGIYEVMDDSDGSKRAVNETVCEQYAQDIGAFFINEERFCSDVTFEDRSSCLHNGTCASAAGIPGMKGADFINDEVGCVAETSGCGPIKHVEQCAFTANNTFVDTRHCDTEVVVTKINDDFTCSMDAWLSSNIWDEVQAIYPFTGAYDSDAAIEACASFQFKTHGVTATHISVHPLICYACSDAATFSTIAGVTASFVGYGDKTSCENAGYGWLLTGNCIPNSLHNDNEATCLAEGACADANGVIGEGAQFIDSEAACNSAKVCGPEVSLERCVFHHTNKWRSVADHTLPNCYKDSVAGKGAVVHFNALEARGVNASNAGALTGYTESCLSDPGKSKIECGTCSDPTKTDIHSCLNSGSCSNENLTTVGDCLDAREGCMYRCSDRAVATQGECEASWDSVAETGGQLWGSSLVLKDDSRNDGPSTTAELLKLDAKLCRFNNVGCQPRKGTPLDETSCSTDANRDYYGYEPINDYDFTTVNTWTGNTWTSGQWGWYGPVLICSDIQHGYDSDACSNSFSASTKSYSGNSCSDPTDCQSKCIDDASCAGWSKLQVLDTFTSIDRILDTNENGRIVGNGGTTYNTTVLPDATVTQAQCNAYAVSVGQSAGATVVTSDDYPEGCMETQTYAQNECLLDGVAAGLSCGTCSDPAMTSSDTCINSCSEAGKTQSECTGACDVSGYDTAQTCVNECTLTADGSDSNIANPTSSNCVDSCSDATKATSGACVSSCDDTGESYNTVETCVSSCSDAALNVGTCVDHCSDAGASYNTLSTCVSSCSDPDANYNTISTCIDTCSDSNIADPTSSNCVNTCSLTDVAATVEACVDTCSLSDVAVTAEACVDTCSLSDVAVTAEACVDTCSLSDVAVTAEACVDTCSHNDVAVTAEACVDTCSISGKDSEVTCGTCTDTSLLTAATCPKYEIITSGAAPISSAANYVDSTECQEFASIMGVTWTGVKNSNYGLWRGCHWDQYDGNDVYYMNFDEPDGNKACDFADNVDCVVKTGNTWTAGTWTDRTFTARTFTARTFTARTFTARTLTERTFYDRTWTARNWLTPTWTDRSWTDRTWTERDFTAREWSGFTWTDRDWTTALVHNKEYVVKYNTHATVDGVDHCLGNDGIDFNGWYDVQGTKQVTTNDPCVKKSYVYTYGDETDETSVDRYRVREDVVVNYVVTNLDSYAKGTMIPVDALSSVQRREWKNNQRVEVVVIDSSGNVPINTAVVTNVDVQTLKIKGVEVTATSANLEFAKQFSTDMTGTELSILNGATLTAVELATLDGITSNGADLTLATSSVVKDVGGTVATGNVTMEELSMTGILKIDSVAVILTGDEMNIVDGYTGNATDLNKLVGRNVLLTGTDLNKFNTRRAEEPFEVLNTEDLNRLNDGALITDSNNDASLRNITVDTVDIESLMLDDEVNAAALKKVGDLLAVIGDTDVAEVLNVGSSVVATDSDGKASIDSMTVATINTSSFAIYDEFSTSFVVDDNPTHRYSGGASADCQADPDSRVACCTNEAVNNNAVKFFVYDGGWCEFWTQAELDAADLAINPNGVAYKRDFSVDLDVQILNAYVQLNNVSKYNTIDFDNVELLADTTAATVALDTSPDIIEATALVASTTCHKEHDYNLELPGCVNVHDGTTRTDVDVGECIHSYYHNGTCSDPTKLTLEGCRSCTDPDKVTAETCVDSCSDENKVNVGTCVDGCSDTNLGTELACEEIEIVTEGARDTSLAIDVAACQYYGENTAGLEWGPNPLSAGVDNGSGETLPTGCIKSYQVIMWNNDDNNNDCGSLNKFCIQRKGTWIERIWTERTWTPREWTVSDPLGCDDEVLSDKTKTECIHNYTQYGTDEIPSLPTYAKADCTEDSSCDGLQFNPICPNDECGTCSDPTKIAQDNCGACSDAAKNTADTCTTSCTVTENEACDCLDEETCGTCDDNSITKNSECIDSCSSSDPEKQSAATCGTCDGSGSTRDNCGVCSVNDKSLKDTCVNTCESDTAATILYNKRTSYFTPTSFSYGGTACTDKEACEKLCQDDPNCEGYSQRVLYTIQKTWGKDEYWGSCMNGAGETDTKCVPHGIGTLAYLQEGNSYGLAGIKSGGGAIGWGSSDQWDDYFLSTTLAATLANDVVQIVSGDYAWAALKSDGSVYAWGKASEGGNAPTITTPLGVSLHSTMSAFAVLNSDGSVQVWGSSSFGGRISSSPNVYTITPTGYADKVVAISSTYGAFAALKFDGSVQVWGHSTAGGTDPSIGAGSGIIKIFSNQNAFAALKSDGSVQVWGDSDNGGTDPSIGAGSGVVNIFNNYGSFVALKEDGSVKAWGSASSGGTDPGITSGVVNLYSNGGAFAAVKEDGSVQAWGDSTRGGADPGIGPGINCVYSNGEYVSGTGCVVKIASAAYAHAALKSDGSVVAWGRADYGGTDPSIGSGVVDVVATSYGFAVLKSDGSVQVWGASDFTFVDGVQTPTPMSDPGLTSGIDKIYGTPGANEFIAMSGTDSYEYGPLLAPHVGGFKNEKPTCGTCNDPSITHPDNCDQYFCATNPDLITVETCGICTSSGTTFDTCGVCTDDDEVLESTCWSGTCNDGTITSDTSCVDHYCVGHTSLTTQDTCGVCSDGSITSKATCLSIVHVDYLGEAPDFSMDASDCENYVTHNSDWSPATTSGATYEGWSNEPLGSYLPRGCIKINGNKYMYNGGTGYEHACSDAGSNTQGAGCLERSNTWTDYTWQARVWTWTGEWTSHWTVGSWIVRSWENGWIGRSWDSGWTPATYTTRAWTSTQSAIDDGTWYPGTWTVGIQECSDSSVTKNDGAYETTRCVDAYPTKASALYGGKCSDATVSLCSDLSSPTTETLVQNGYSADAAKPYLAPDTTGWSSYSCDSTDRSGKFKISSNCQLDGEVVLNGDLTIVGSSQDMTALKTITATVNKRIFQVSNAGYTLELWYVKLTGGKENPSDRGGAIFINTGGGTLNLYNSLLTGNECGYGGAIAAKGASDTNRNAIVNIYGSTITDNEATYWDGGGIFMAYAVGTIRDTIFDDNIADDAGANVYIEYSHVEITNSIITNGATALGGGIALYKSSSVLILRQTTITDNTASSTALGGHQIYINQGPTLELVNTVITNADKDIYERIPNSPTWNTCDNDPCTEAPFNYGCSAVDAANPKLGVQCKTYCGADEGAIFQYTFSDSDLLGCGACGVPDVSFSSTLYSYGGTQCADKEACEETCTIPSNNCDGYTEYRIGGVQAWGSSGDKSISNNVVQIVSNDGATVALKMDGSIENWGDAGYGGGALCSDKTHSSAYACLVDAATFGEPLTSADTRYIDETECEALAGVFGYTYKDSDHSSINGHLYPKGCGWYSGASTTIVWNKVISTGIGNNICGNAYSGIYFACLHHRLGNTWENGITPTGDMDKVVAISSTDRAFAVIKGDGSVRAWGNSAYGGSDPGITSGTTAIYSAARGFAAIKDDGSVQVWGHSDYSYNLPSETLDVVEVVTNYYAMAALNSDGSVQVWGDGGYGGDITEVWDQNGANIGGSLPSDIAENVVSITAAKSAFAALKSDGSVHVWGSKVNGGTSPGITSGAVKIYSTDRAFAALKSDGSVQVWGNSAYGGTDPGIGAGTDCVYTDGEYVSGTGCVVNIYSHKEGQAFAALKDDGSVQVWGNPDAAGEISHHCGGCGDASSGVTTITPTGDADKVVAISAAQDAMAAIKADGSVEIWGNPDYGGLIGTGTDAEGTTTGPSTITPTGDADKVVAISATDRAFAALKADGSVQVWGQAGYGGTDPSIGAGSGITVIYSSPTAFTASTGTITYEYGPRITLRIGGVKKTHDSVSMILDGNECADNDAIFYAASLSFSEKRSMIQDEAKRLCTDDPDCEGYTVFGDGTITYGKLLVDTHYTASCAGDVDCSAITSYEKTSTGNVMVKQGSFSLGKAGSNGYTRGDTGDSYVSKPMTVAINEVEAKIACTNDNDCEAVYETENGIWYNHDVSGTDSSVLYRDRCEVTAKGRRCSDGSDVTESPCLYEYNDFFTSDYKDMGLVAATDYECESGCSSYTSADTGASLPTSVFTTVFNTKDFKIVKLVHTEGAYAALYASESNSFILSWGDSNHIANAPHTDYTDIDAELYNAADAHRFSNVFANKEAFAAIKADGSIQVWGKVAWGGCQSGTGLQTDSNLPATTNKYTCAPTGNDFVDIVSGEYAFVAIRSDGSLAEWGRDRENNYVANEQTMGRMSWYDTAVHDAPTDGGYVKVFGNGGIGAAGMWVALKADGSITSWGVHSSTVDYQPYVPTDAGYVDIILSNTAVAARKADGTIKTWGPDMSCASASCVNPGIATGMIISNNDAFAALQADGSIISWGKSNYGGTGKPSGAGYITLASSESSFAAIGSDGSLENWGYLLEGFGSETSKPTDTGYVSIVGTRRAFAALKADGSIATWGRHSFGGTGAPAGTGWTKIVASSAAFGALKVEGLNAGSLPATSKASLWGERDNGGGHQITGGPTAEISGVNDIVTNDKSFIGIVDNQLAPFTPSFGTNDPTVAAVPLLADCNNAESCDGISFTLDRQWVEGIGGIAGQTRSDRQETYSSFSCSDGSAKNKAECEIEPAICPTSIVTAAATEEACGECSDNSHNTKTACEAASEIWTSHLIPATATGDTWGEHGTVAFDATAAECGVSICDGTAESNPDLCGTCIGDSSKNKTTCTGFYCKGDANFYNTFEDCRDNPTIPGGGGTRVWTERIWKDGFYLQREHKDVDHQVMEERKEDTGNTYSYGKHYETYEFIEDTCGTCNDTSVIAKHLCTSPNVWTSSIVNGACTERRYQYLCDEPKLGYPCEAAVARICSQVTDCDGFNVRGDCTNVTTCKSGCMDDLSNNAADCAGTYYDNTWTYGPEVIYGQDDGPGDAEPIESMSRHDASEADVCRSYENMMSDTITDRINNEDVSVKDLNLATLQYDAPEFVKTNPIGAAADCSQAGQIINRGNAVYICTGAYTWKLIGGKSVLAVEGNYAKEVSWSPHEHYYDEGAVCFDANSLEDWGHVAVSGDLVDRKVCQSYTITYTGMDSGACADMTIERTVTVTDCP